jgi:uncharacterized protein with HEPN domain
MKDDKLYLVHIQECIKRIESFVGGGQKEFLASELIQDAVIRNLEIIGEATKQISDGLKSKYSDVPWRRIAGLRDVLIHDYMGVDRGEVWGHLENHLPTLKTSIQKILQDLKK